MEGAGSHAASQPGDEPRGPGAVLDALHEHRERDDPIDLRSTLGRVDPPPAPAVGATAIAVAGEVGGVQPSRYVHDGQVMDHQRRQGPRAGGAEPEESQSLERVLEGLRLDPNAEEAVELYEEPRQTFLWLRSARDDQTPGDR